MNDSFESIISDARLNSCTYAHRRENGPVNRTSCRCCMFGDPVSCGDEMYQDLVRRCKDVAAGEPRSGCEVADDKSAGRSVNIGEVATFPGVKPDKAQALKVLEEAAEVFGAWQAFDDYELFYECADVIQATCNLVAAFGVSDFAPYMEECRIRNEERERFDG